jgi:carboxyl-terminal processing protease
MMGRRTLIWLVAAVALLVAFFGGFELHSRSVSRMAAGTPDAQAATIRDEVVTALQNSYYRPLAPAVIHAPTLHGVLRALDDPYTEYLNPQAYQQLLDNERSGFSGVGLALSHARGGLLVTITLPGMPAAAGGVRSGDLIVAIDGRSLRHVGYQNAVDRLHGAPGSKVVVTVRRPGVAHPLRLTLERRPVHLPIAFDRVIRFDGRRYEYLRLPGFVSGAGDSVRAIAQRARRSHVSGLVLDLRGNVGGLLDEAVQVTRVFQGSGVVVSTRGLHEPMRIYSAGEGAVAKLPMVVLVDGSTASAAEVVAGSLQRAGRAIVVGSRSYGKGTVQAVEPLSRGGALKLTVAVFQLAGGQQVNRRGVMPDVAVINRPSTRVDEALRAALRVLARR